MSVLFSIFLKIVFLSFSLWSVDIPDKKNYVVDLTQTIKANEDEEMNVLLEMLSEEHDITPGVFIIPTVHGVDIEMLKQDLLKAWPKLENRKKHSFFDQRLFFIMAQKEGQIFAVLGEGLANELKGKSGKLYEQMQNTPDSFDYSKDYFFVPMSKAYEKWVFFIKGMKEMPFEEEDHGLDHDEGQENTKTQDPNLDNSLNLFLDQNKGERPGWFWGLIGWAFFVFCLLTRGPVGRWFISRKVNRYFEENPLKTPASVYSQSKLKPVSAKGKIFILVFLMINPGIFIFMGLSEGGPTSSAIFIAVATLIYVVSIKLNLLFYNNAEDCQKWREQFGSN